MSRNTRSGGGAPRRSNSTASRPLAHSSMRVTLLICCNTPRRRRRAGASSSTMIARMIGKWNLDDGQRPTGSRRVGQLEPMARTVQLMQSSPSIGESQSSPAGAAVEAWPVVAHFEMQAVALPDRGDRNLGDAAVRDDTVSDGVLYERLQ